jgi:hypothetical protein
MRSWENVNELNATYFAASCLLTNKTLPPYNFTEKKDFSSTGVKDLAREKAFFIINAIRRAIETSGDHLGNRLSARKGNLRRPSGRDSGN